MQINDTLVSILYKFFQGENLSALESEQLKAWESESDENKIFLKTIESKDELVRELRKFYDYNAKEQWERFRLNTIEPQNGQAPVRRFMHWRLFISTCAVLVLCVTGFYIFRSLNSLRVDHQPDIRIVNLKETNIKPGSDKATLTLANGSIIELNTASKGILAVEGKIKVEMPEAGLISYPNHTEPIGTGLYNIVTTPSGGQYKVRLPDGSLVWLNAASSIRFTTSFGRDRRVSISGEVYIEVAKDKTRPFYVSAGNMEIQVLGTSFDINSYADEPHLTATLGDGSIRVVAAGSKDAVTLLPGQQAQISNNHPSIRIIRDANVEQVIAWKNGLFDFTDKSFPDVMRQLSRWYNIDITYNNGIPPVQLWGKMDRQLNLSQVLKVLEKMKVKYVLQDRHLTVF